MAQRYTWHIEAEAKAQLAAIKELDPDYLAKTIVDLELELHELNKICKVKLEEYNQLTSKAYQAEYKADRLKKKLRAMIAPKPQITPVIDLYED